MLNIEFKAKVADLAPLRLILQSFSARYLGRDFQRDTYFNVPQGRLKLREGQIEQALIFYQRPEQAGFKTSDILLYPAPTDERLKAILLTALGQFKVVEKYREIYLVDNVKIHLDELANLGYFVEVEALDEQGKYNPETLQTQCASWAERFGVKPEDYVAASYSDMLG